MFNLLSRLFARRPANRRPRVTRLGLESLECREVLSAVVQVPVPNHVAEQTLKKEIKKNILTLQYLPAGNYSASYTIHIPAGPKLLAPIR